MFRRTAFVVLAAVLAAAVVAIGASAQGGPSGASESCEASSDARAAGRVAVEAVGGGTVECVERDGAEWEVEVNRNGERHEVELGASLNVVERERDDDDGDERGDDRDEPDDDRDDRDEPDDD